MLIAPKGTRVAKPRRAARRRNSATTRAYRGLVPRHDHLLYRGYRIVRDMQARRWTLRRPGGPVHQAATLKGAMATVDYLMGGRRANPQGTRVARCVQAVKRRKPVKGRRRVRSAVAVCEVATGQNYRTGRPLAARKGNPAAYPYLISQGGTRLARFLTAGHAKQYAQALADKTGRQVRLQRA